MAAIDDRRVDLNLLVVLDALLELRSVTAAARRLGLTQSTISHALARLRDLFGDPLLVRVGRGMEPTPRAEALAPALRRALADMRRLLAHEDRFDPATSTRTFSIVCPDVLAAFLPQLLGRIAREAPGVGLETTSPADLDMASALALGTADVALGPAREEGPGLVQRVIGRVRWCVLARRGHPGVRRGRLDRATWSRYPHVVVRAGGPGPGLVGRSLEAAGVPRRVGFVAPGFLAAPFAVAYTDFFFAAPEELIGSLARTLDLVVLDPPVALPPVPVALTWHERKHAEPGHRWLREILVAIVREALEHGAASRRPVRARAPRAKPR